MTGKSPRIALIHATALAMAPIESDGPWSGA